MRVLLLFAALCVSVSATTITTSITGSCDVYAVPSTPPPEPYLVKSYPTDPNCGYVTGSSWNLNANLQVSLQGNEPISGMNIIMGAGFTVPPSLYPLPEGVSEYRLWGAIYETATISTTLTVNGGTGFGLLRVQYGGDVGWTNPSNGGWSRMTLPGGAIAPHGATDHYYDLPFTYGEAVPFEVTAYLEYEPLWMGNHYAYGAGYRVSFPFVTDSGGNRTYSPQVTFSEAVPEPSTLLLFGIGAVAMIGLRRRGCSRA